MPSTNTLEARVDSWLAAYCQPDAALRLKAIQQVWNAQGHLADPPFEVYGYPGLSGAADGLLKQFPGHRFERSTAVDTHHRFARYGWRLVGPDGKPAVDGVDFVELDVDGRLMRVIGFFGANLPSPPPPAMTGDRAGRRG